MFTLQTQEWVTYLDGFEPEVGVGVKKIDNFFAFFILAFKAFIKPFEAPRRSVKIKI